MITEQLVRVRDLLVHVGNSRSVILHLADKVVVVSDRQGADGTVGD